MINWSEPSVRRITTSSRAAFPWLGFGHSDPFPSNFLPISSLTGVLQQHSRWRELPTILAYLHITFGFIVYESVERSVGRQPDLLERAVLREDSLQVLLATIFIDVWNEKSSVSEIVPSLQ